MASMDALLDLQQLDLAIDRLLDQIRGLPERDLVAQAEARHVELKAALDGAKAELHATTKEIQRLDDEVQVIEDKVHHEESRMYSGQVTNPKEVQALSDEVASLKRRIEPLEMRDLELEEVKEQQEERVAKLEQALAAMEIEVQQARDALTSAEADVNVNLDEEKKRRAEIAAVFDSDLIERYEEIRGRKRGVGVGKLEGSMCSACREDLPSVEVEGLRAKAREGNTLLVCDACRRLLIVDA